MGMNETSTEDMDDMGGMTTPSDAPGEADTSSDVSGGRTASVVFTLLAGIGSAFLVVA